MNDNELQKKLDEKLAARVAVAETVKNKKARRENFISNRICPECSGDIVAGECVECGTSYKQETARWQSTIPSTTQLSLIDSIARRIRLSALD